MPDDPQKFNGDGLSVSLVKGRKRRVYDTAVQVEIDVQAKGDRPESSIVADRRASVH